jgi:hypothetical protein
MPFYTQSELLVLLVHRCFSPRRCEGNALVTLVSPRAQVDFPNVNEASCALVPVSWCTYTRCAPTHWCSHQPWNRLTVLSKLTAVKADSILI